jgi:hypothetical protein
VRDPFFLRRVGHEQANGERITPQDRFKAEIRARTILMRKRIDLAAGLILVATVILLASCKSGGGGNTTSKEDVTDPNISFSNLGTHETP